MSDAARSMAGAQNPVGNKLREALGEAQQNELEMHMRQNAQFIRQGYGSSAWVRENSVSLGLNNLRDQLQQAQAANQQQNGKQKTKPSNARGHRVLHLPYVLIVLDSAAFHLVWLKSKSKVTRTYDPE